MRSMGKAHIFVALVFLSNACGVSDNVSQTRKEVEATNQRMDTLLEQTKAMVTHTENLVHQMDRIIHKHEETSSNTHELVDQTRKLHETMSSRFESLQESVDKAAKTAESMEELIEQGKTNETLIARIVEENKTLNEKLSENLEELRKIRGATFQTLDKVRAQEDFLLTEKLQALASLVRDPVEENHFRIAAATIFFQLALELEESKRAQLYESIFFTNLEMCGATPVNPVGTLCTHRILEKGKRKENAKPGQLQERVLQAKTAIGLFMRKYFPKEEKHEAVQYITSIGPLATNLVWALGLDPQTYRNIYSQIFNRHENPQRQKVLDFFRFTRDVYLETLQFFVFREETGTELRTDELQEFHRQARLLRLILEFPEMDDELVREKANEAILKLGEILRGRSEALSEMDDKILQSIEAQDF